MNSQPLEPGGAGTPAASPLRLLHEFFAESARRHPDAIAVDVPPGRGRAERALTTYAELDRASEELGRSLAPFVRGETILGILLPRNSADLYAAQLAVLKVGAAFVCVDPSFPDERIREILEDAGVRALLTNTAGAARIRKLEIPTLSLVEVRWEKLNATALQRGAETAGSQIAGGIRPTHESLAYLIYTSGTTGRPKGVMIEHRGITNLIAGDVEAFGLTPRDRVSQNSSASYDSSLEEIWLAFSVGATLVVMDEEAARLGPDLIEWLRTERITVFCPPPTLLRATGCADPESALPDLRFVYVGGEALPEDIADRWSRGRLLVNGYGPTECSVTCLRERVLGNETVSIGRPIPGMTALVLDEQGNEVAHETNGELHIGGIGLARGYWRSPEITAEKFIHHSLHGRLYRTGDLAHRDAAGRFFYHGRIDAQVKLRGYRIELGEIESRLVEQPGVRAAACRLQEEEGEAVLVAFIVARDPAERPTADHLRSSLAAALPSYMVPARLGFLEHLPTTIGGKLDRKALPRLDGTEAQAEDRPRKAPGNKVESAIAKIFTKVLGRQVEVSVDQNFFRELGGDSLRAARVVTEMRGHPMTAWVTVRDIYEAPTVEKLAALSSSIQQPSAEPVVEPMAAMGRTHPFLVTLIQMLWLAAALLAGSAAGAWIAFEGLPDLTASLGLIPTLLVAPLLGSAATTLYAPLSILLVVVIKRLVIGTYRPARVPVWSGYFLRNWIVQQSARLIPWRTIEGTELLNAALRALGARIGQRVHIHRGVDLRRGGWDLLELGDDVTLCQDAALRLVDLEEGHLVIGPVSLGAGATLETRAGAAHNTIIGPGASLAALSSLPTGARIPAGERWDGIPARPAGRTQPAGQPTTGAKSFSPSLHGMLLIAGRNSLRLILALPVASLTAGTCWALGVRSEQFWSGLHRATLAGSTGFLGLLWLLLAVPVTVAWSAAVMRLMGPVREGVIGRWSLAYVRVWLKTGLLFDAGEWLSGTLFWPVWLRWAGMRLGKGCEISTILDSIPELIEIGDESFLADGIYLAGPGIHQGRVTLARTVLGRNTFLGNHAVIAGGQKLPDDILLGVSTVSDDRVVRPGSSWFGLPPFELPRREVIEADRTLTHEPTRIRYWNRVFWELLRFALPIVPALMTLVWYHLLDLCAVRMSRVALLGIAAPLITLGAGMAVVVYLVALKWCLLGRVRPGQHALWSCWCSRWDFLYVAWGQHGAPVLERFEGTLILNGFLRAMGMKIGNQVVLGPGFSHVVDPDMLEVQDHATVNAMFQAHTFEDRVLKIDRVVVRRGSTLGSATVPLYGADIGEATWVGAHSVIMKDERLLPGLRYQGSPTQVVDRR